VSRRKNTKGKRLKKTDYLDAKIEESGKQIEFPGWGVFCVVGCGEVGKKEAGKEEQDERRPNLKFRGKT